MFRFNGASWAEEQKLTASDAADDNFFGVSVSLSEDRALVGARGADCASGAEHCGAAYMFAHVIVPTGACCDVVNPDPIALEGFCTNGVMSAACQGDTKTWHEGGVCSAVTCDADFPLEYLRRWRL